MPARHQMHVFASPEPYDDGDDWATAMQQTQPDVVVKLAEAAEREAEQAKQRAAREHLLQSKQW